MNIYRHRFSVKCPNNDQNISYTLEIRAVHVVMAEEIVRLCESAKGIEKPYHENIANMLQTEIGGLQTLVAFHHGVQIETVRGAL